MDGRFESFIIGRTIDVILFGVNVVANVDVLLLLLLDFSFNFVDDNLLIVVVGVAVDDDVAELPWWTEGESGPTDKEWWFNGDSVVLLLDALAYRDEYNGLDVEINDGVFINLLWLIFVILGNVVTWWPSPLTCFNWLRAVRDVECGRIWLLFAIFESFMTVVELSLLLFAIIGDNGVEGKILLFRWFKLRLLSDSDRWRTECNGVDIVVGPLAIIRPDLSDGFWPTAKPVVDEERLVGSNCRLRKFWSIK